MHMDLVIEVENEPGALAGVARAISDAGVNISAATCVGAHKTAELHILVPNSGGATEHSLSLEHLNVTRKREVVIVEIDDRPGALADLSTPPRSPLLWGLFCACTSRVPGEGIAATRSTCPRVP